MYDGQHEPIIGIEISWSRPRSTGIGGLQARQKKAADYARKIGPTAVPMRERGLSLHQIAVALVEQGIWTRRGAAWTASSVRIMLQNFDAT